ncbi:response regulator [Planosporangium thailandense]|uniref:Response regulator n=1 Tax=Planosporangium thailandense TaxID=765197 RepID=A0ABX0Y2S2_9ACTN|nr:response regulator [Planosporangium thailandense]NJC72333.1 response regulator [Planosporangium thailandense]
MALPLLEHDPNRRPLPTVVAPRRPGPPPTTARATVLVIDDDPDVRELLTAQLSCEGYHVRVAEDGPSGLAAARTISPDIIVLDVRMPQMTGFDVCTRLRAETSTAHVPVLILSAYANPADMRAPGHAAGADGYLLKPYRREDLVDRIEALLIGAR